MSKADFLATGVSNDAVLLRERLSDLEEPCMKAVVMFGSRARGEARERSDVDLLVLHEGCGIGDLVERRRHFYSLLREAVGEEFEDVTVVDMELGPFLKPTEISGLLLNVYWDAVIVYDRTHVLRSFLEDVRKRITESGLKRARDGRVYRWVLPKPLEEVRIL